MTDTLEHVVGMSMEDFLERSAKEGPFELIDGEIVPRMPTVWGHSKIIKRLLLAFLAEEQKGLGQVFPETAYVLTYSPAWVKGSRIPDLLFIRSERLTQYEQDTPSAEAMPLILIPDLVVEVVSPTDVYSDVNERVRRYVEDGVGLILVVDPPTKQVAITRQGSSQQTILTEQGTLTLEPILPDFNVKLADLFA